MALAPMPGIACSYFLLSGNVVARRYFSIFHDWKRQSKDVKRRPGWN
jgi:hypothetical protein